MKHHIPSVRTTKLSNADTILIGNDGPLISSSNFWRSKQAQSGTCFVSFNAGIARLLVPHNRMAMAIELSLRVKHAVLSFGFWRQQGERRALEWMAEDGSDAPFAIWMCEESVDQVLVVPRGCCIGMRAAIWIEENGHPKLLSEMPAFVRSVAEIPHLQALALSDRHFSSGGDDRR